jgi:hypothetical protein
LKWWCEFLPVFTGVSMMAVEEWSYPDTVFSCDACLEGLGGMFEDKFVHVIFPPFITEQNVHIPNLKFEPKPHYHKKQEFSYQSYIYPMF